MRMSHWIILAMACLAGAVLVVGCKTVIVQERGPAAVAVVAPEATVVYVPEAPPPVIVERPGPPPSRLHIWIAGYWIYDHGRYAWVRGHWETPPRARAVWVRPEWAHTEHGWMHSPGHWR